MQIVGKILVNKIFNYTEKKQPEIFYKSPIDNSYS